jgi:hypothetical protein
MWDIVYRLNDETMQILLIMRENARSWNYIIHSQKVGCKLSRRILKMI